MITLDLYDFKTICMQMSELGAANYAKRFEPQKDNISQREAYIKFGEQKVKRWLKKELASRIRSGTTENSKFNYSFSELLSIQTAEKINFLAKDVVEWIEHSNITEMVRSVDDDEKLSSVILSAGQNRVFTMLTENGLYEVLMQSRKPIAKQFKKGVKEILHSIRKHGGYIAALQDDTPELIMARALQVAQQTIENHALKLKMAEGTIKEQAPKVEYYDKCLESKGYLTVNMIAADFGISHQKLNKLLCEWGVQYRQTECYFLHSEYRGMGYTVHRPHPYLNSRGETVTRQHMYWTERGKKFIVELYNRKLAA